MTTLTTLRSARPLVGIALAAGLLAGCAGQPDGGQATPTSTESTGSTPAPAPTTSAPPQESTRETVTTECTPVERKGQKLGVTVPPGFTVTMTPQGGGDFSQSEQVNLLAVAQRRNASGELPVVVVVVYGYGAGERNGADALTASVRNFRQLVGAADAEGAVAAKPATVGGVKGSAGGIADEKALDYQAPDGKPSPLHWWSVPSGDAQFVVTMASRDSSTDKKFATAFREGLKPGGC